MLSLLKLESVVVLPVISRAPRLKVTPAELAVADSLWPGDSRRLASAHCMQSRVLSSTENSSEMKAHEIDHKRLNAEADKIVDAVASVGHSSALLNP